MYIIDNYSHGYKTRRILDLENPVMSQCEKPCNNMNNDTKSLSEPTQQPTEMKLHTTIHCDPMDQSIMIDWFMGSGGW